MGRHSDEDIEFIRGDTDLNTPAAAGEIRKPPVTGQGISANLATRKPRDAALSRREGKKVFRVAMPPTPGGLVDYCELVETPRPPFETGHPHGTAGIRGSGYSSGSCRQQPGHHEDQARTLLIRTFEAGMGGIQGIRDAEM